MKANFVFDSNFADSLVGAGEREQGAMAARNREPVLAVAKLPACRPLLPGYYGRGDRKVQLRYKSRPIEPSLIRSRGDSPENTLPILIFPLLGK